MEQTLVFVKPDGVQRGLIGEVISRLERRGLRLAAAKFVAVSQELAEEHYAIHKGKPFYDGLIKIHHISTGDGNGMGRTECNRCCPPDHGRHQTG